MDNHNLCGRAGQVPILMATFLILLAVSIPGLSQSNASTDYEAALIENPGIDLWRNVRQRDSAFKGTSQIKNVDSGVLINPQADRWARFRVGKLVDYGFFLLAAMTFLIALFYGIRGKIYIEGGLSGKMVHRFNDFQRVSHWVLAVVFIFLAVTGLTLLFGRTLLIPVLGNEFFSVLASSSKEAHNLFGPIFLVSLLLMFFGFVKRNIYAKGDLAWLLRGGGMIGKSHLSVGFFNMGEKSWYWLVILIGLVISASGLVLVSPSLGQGRVIMELSHVVHSISAIALIAASFGHIYLATTGTEGAIEGMKSGYVDIKWAEAHHDRWAKECLEGGRIVSAEDYAKLQGKMASNLIVTVPVSREEV